MNTYIARLLKTQTLIWFQDHEFGYLKSEGFKYDEAYFEEYQRRSATDMGKALTKARHEFVMKHYNGPLCDVGIGSGAFIEYRIERDMETKGYDINHRAREWLLERGLFCCPYTRQVEAATFWDSLEHIEEPWNMLQNVREWVFVSTPYYNDPIDIRFSRHYKPNEHIWYFGSIGLSRFMREFGFEYKGASYIESDLGRDNIYTAAFKRIR